MTPKEIKRLGELSAMAPDKLNAEQKSELASLQAKAAALAEDGKQSSADDVTMTADDVKALVTEALKNFNANAPNALTADQVKGVVETVVKGEKLDAKTITDSVLAEVKKILPSAGASTEDVKNIVAEALKNFRPGSKMQFDAPGDTDVEFPIAHRAGNLSVDGKQLLNVMTGKALNADIPESLLKDAEKRGEAREKRLVGQLRVGGVNAQKALTTSGAGTGAEFMNVTLSSTLLQRMYLESQLAATLLASEIQMPTDPYKFPLATTRPKFKIGAENSAPTAGDPGTSGLTLTSKKLIAKVEYSYEADEDSIIAILPMILAQLGSSAAESYEDAVINGDTAATHQDSDTQLDAVAGARAFDGIRKLALAQSSLKLSLASGGISTANIGALRKLLKRWGVNPKDLVILAGVNGYNDLVMLPETLTAEKVGDKGSARIYTGMAPNLLGMDIIASAMMREDLNASGVYDGTTTTKGSIAILHKASWISGVRRGFTLEQDRDISAQKKFVVASFRRAFAPIESLASTKAAALGYNYSS